MFLSQLAKAVYVNPLLPVSTKTYVQVPRKKWLITAWTCAIFIIIICWFFTLLYAANFGSNHTILWLVTLLMGLLEDIFFFEPLRIILISVLLAFIFRTVQGDTIEIDPVYPSKLDGNNFGKIFLREYMRRQEPEYRAPPVEVLVETIKKKLNRENWIYSFCNFLFLIILISATFALIISLNIGTKYQCGYILNYVLTNPGRNPGFMLDRAFNKSDLFEFFTQTLLPNIHTVLWYNGERLPNEFGEDIAKSPLFKFKGWALDYCSKLIGVVRLRQHRIQKTSTVSKVTKYFQPWFNESIGYLHFMNRETRRFEEGWVEYTKSLFNMKPNNQKIWYYTTMYHTHTFITGRTGITYYGGGYIQDLSYSLGSSQQKFVQLYMNNWFDNYTRAVFSEKVFYNIHANVFSYVEILMEHLPSGVYVSKTYVDVDSLILPTDPTELITLSLYVFIFIVIIAFAIFKFLEFSKKGLAANFFSWHGIITILLIILGMSAVSAYLYKLMYAFLYYEETSSAARDHFIAMAVTFYYDFISNFLIGIFCLVTIILLLQKIFQNFGHGKFQACIIMSRKYIFFVCFIICLYSFIVHKIVKLLFQDDTGTFILLFLIGALDPSNKLHTKKHKFYIFWGLFMYLLILTITSIFIATYLMSISKLIKEKPKLLKRIRKTSGKYKNSKHSSEKKKFLPRDRRFTADKVINLKKEKIQANVYLLTKIK